MIIAGENYEYNIKYLNHFTSGYRRKAKIISGIESYRVGLFI